MTKSKKEFKNLCIKLDKEIADKLEEYCNKMGQTKTTAIERILKSHFEEIERQNDD